jgi:hypothetical protein
MSKGTVRGKKHEIVESFELTDLGRESLMAAEKKQ